MCHWKEDSTSVTGGAFARRHFSETSTWFLLMPSPCTGCTGLLKCKAALQHTPAVRQHWSAAIGCVAQSSGVSRGRNLISRMRAMIKEPLLTLLFLKWEGVGRVAERAQRGNLSPLGSVSIFPRESSYSLSLCHVLKSIGKCLWLACQPFAAQHGHCTRCSFMTLI